MSYVGHRVPDRHHAEDLVQEAFLRLFRAARNGGYTGRANVSTWLFTIADNCATDYLRASGRQPLTLESDTSEETTTTRQAGSTAAPSPDLDPVEAAAPVAKVKARGGPAGRLPEEQRRVVALKVLAA